MAPTKPLLSDEEVAGAIQMEGDSGVVSKKAPQEPRTTGQTIRYAVVHPVAFARERPYTALTATLLGVGGILFIVLMSVYLTPDSTTRAFKSNGVIPDTLDSVSYERGTTLIVTYGDTPVTFGREYSRAQTAFAPRVDITGKGYFTYLMVDPDAPARDMAIISERLHWMVVNIPDGDFAAGETIHPYEGPNPRVGLHRYVHLLFRQPDNEVITLPPLANETYATPGLAYFSTRNFIRGFKMGNPIRGTYFQARPKEERPDGGL